MFLYAEDSGNKRYNIPYNMAMEITQFMALWQIAHATSSVVPEHKGSGVGKGFLFTFFMSPVRIKDYMMPTNCIKSITTL